MSTVTERLQALAELLERGLLTRTEFDQQKAALFSATSTGPGFASTGEMAAYPVWMQPDYTGGSGLRLGAYTLYERLGIGGMGAVFKARHVVASVAKRQGGDVAVKVLLPHYANSPKFRDRFSREAELSMRLIHPAIIHTLDLVIDGDTLAIVMEFIEGVPLDEIAGEGIGSLPPGRVLPLMCSLLEGVAYAHQVGVIHRDLKPANILLTSEGEPKILDLGIAKEQDSADKHTGVGDVLGSGQYMAPEQFNDSSTVDLRADLYALGMTAWEILAGRFPWSDQASTMNILTSKLTQDLPSLGDFAPQLPQGLVRFVDRAVNRDPADRFQTAGSMLASARALLEYGLVPVIEEPWRPLSRVPENDRQSVGFAGGGREDVSASFNASGVFRAPLLEGPTVPVAAATSPAPPRRTVVMDEATASGTFVPPSDSGGLGHFETAPMSGDIGLASRANVPIQSAPPRRPVHRRTVVMDEEVVPRPEPPAVPPSVVDDVVEPPASTVRVVRPRRTRPRREVKQPDHDEEDEEDEGSSFALPFLLGILLVLGMTIIVVLVVPRLRGGPAGQTEEAELTPDLEFEAGETEELLPDLEVGSAAWAGADEPPTTSAVEVREELPRETVSAEASTPNDALAELAADVIASQTDRAAEVSAEAAEVSAEGSEPEPEAQQERSLTHTVPKKFAFLDSEVAFDVGLTGATDGCRVTLLWHRAGVDGARWVLERMSVTAGGPGSFSVGIRMQHSMGREMRYFIRARCEDAETSLLSGSRELPHRIKLP